MSKISDDLLEYYKKILKSAEKKTDYQIKNLKSEYKLFGDGGFYDNYLSQKKWIDEGKQGHSRNYYDLNDKNTHILFRMVDDWENNFKNRSRIERQKKAFMKFKSTEGTTPLELKIKGLEYAIKDSQSKDHLKNVNTIYYPTKTAKDLVKDLYKIYQEDFDKTDRKILTKIEKVIEFYNETFRSLD
jgi:polyhydroxyalkanoate synthesis regulator phasin